MALIERVKLAAPYAISEIDASSPGLRISLDLSQRRSPICNVRCTTSSFSDYAEWNPEEHATYRFGLITDGACS